MAFQTDPLRPARPPRERAINAPFVIVLVIAVLVAVHVARLYLLTEEADFEALIDYAFVPLRLLIWLDPDRLREVISDIAAQNPADEAARQLAMARYVVADGEGRPYTLLTYALLHGDWAHLAINCASLLAFGTPLARRIGTVRTLIFLVITAVAGILLHFLLHPAALVPVIGASASASGVMAGAIRFIFGPAGHSGRFMTEGPVHTVAELARDRRAVMFIGVWFALNLLFGVGAQPLGLAPGGIAWEAHMGGFIAGFFLMPLIDRRQPATLDDRYAE